MMLLCIVAAGETLCALIVPTDRPTLGVFRDGIEDGVGFKIQIDTKMYRVTGLFHDSLRNVTTPEIEELLVANGMANDTAVLLIGNSSARTSLDSIALLSRYQVTAITFPSHTSGIFQMLDVLFFSVFKHIKEHFGMALFVPLTESYIMQMFRAYAAAEASSIVRASFSCTGFIHMRHQHGDYSLEFDEGTTDGPTEFREVWDSDYPMEKLSPRWLTS
jgi:hypothetical protein